MAGHSQFANIKHKKEKEDAKRAKVFTKLAREITVATREGGKDANFNPRLRLSIEKAKEANMPKDNIERAIKKGAGELGSEIIEEVRYEGYAPGGVAVIVDAVTDNRNRTASEVRHAFNKNGGSLGETGSVSWSFKKLGIFEIEKENVIEEEIMEFALNNSAEDFKVTSDSFIIVCTPNSFYSFSENLEKRFKIKNSSISMISNNLINLEGEEKENVLNLIEALESLEDVQEVYSNLEN